DDREPRAHLAADLRVDEDAWQCRTELRCGGQHDRVLDRRHLAPETSLLGPEAGQTRRDQPPGADDDPVWHARDLAGASRGGRAGLRLGPALGACPDSLRDLLL